MADAVMTAEEIARDNAELETASAEEVLRWAATKFGRGLTICPSL